MLHRILYISFCLFFFSFNVNSEILNNYNPNLIDNTKEFCEKNNSRFTNNKILLDQLNHISIDIDDQRKWYTNLFRAVVWHGINTPPKFRKNFDAKVIINFKDNLECKFKAKVRLHGDAKDHLQNTSDGQPYASLHVSLVEDNIDSIVKFILFIPETRNYDNEIFSSILFKNLNFLAPRTKYLNAYVNGIKTKYIFQEKISKEMLENNMVTEGPIIEASHRFLWPEDKTNFIDESLVQGRISNQKWSTKNKYNLKKTTLALSKFNEGLIDDQTLHFNTNRLAYKNEDAQKELNEYQAIVTSLGGFHALSPRNMKYYYDPINLTFRPIYYDGDANILTNNPNNSRYNDPGNEFTFHAKIGANSAFQKVKELNFEKIQIELNKNGVDIKLDKLLEVKNKILSRLELISKKNVKQKEFRSINAYFSSVSKKNQNKRIVFFDDNLNEIKVCKFEIGDCEIETLSLKEIEKLFSGQLKKNGNFYIFVSNNYDNYVKGKFLDNSQFLSKNFKQIILENTEVIYSNDMQIKIDNKLKKVNLIQKSNDQIALFQKGNLENWEISFTGKEINNFQHINNFFSGCINFFNIELNNVKIDIDNAMCNDAVNFINSYGKIKKLNVKDAKTDAIDFDFSNLNIENIIVTGAFNDCVDMSYGNYNIDNLKLTQCGDKAISVGESSIFKGENVQIQNSKVGIATKDSSLSNVNKVEIFNTSLCAAAYRKKQEFYGAKININKFKCDKNEIYYQDGSKIKIINEL